MEVLISKHHLCGFRGYCCCSSYHHYYFDYYLWIFSSAYTRRMSYTFHCSSFFIHFVWMQPKVLSHSWHNVYSSPLIPDVLRRKKLFCILHTHTLSVNGCVWKWWIPPQKNIFLTGNSSIFSHQMHPLLARGQPVVPEESPAQMLAAKRKAIDSTCSSLRHLQAGGWCGWCGWWVEVWSGWWIVGKLE